MDWTEFLKFWGIGSAFFAAVGTLIAYLIKTTFKSFLDKDIEKFKANLQQNQVQFSTLHLERAKVIKEIYHGLVDTETSMGSFLLNHSIDIESEEHRVAITQLEKFQNFVEKNKLYFSDDVSILLDEFVRTLHEMDFDKSVAKKLDKSAELFSIADIAMKAITLRRKIWDDFHQNKIPKLKQELKKNFQQVLGV